MSEVVIPFDQTPKYELVFDTVDVYGLNTRVDVVEVSCADYGCKVAGGCRFVHKMPGNFHIEIHFKPGTQANWREREVRQPASP